MTTNGRLKWVIGLLVVCLAMSLGMWQGARMRPTVVATVNLMNVINGLDEQAAEKARINEMAEQYKKTAEARKQEAEMLQQDLEIFQPGSSEYEEAVAKVAGKGAALNAYVEWVARRVDEEHAVVLGRLYERIKETLESLQSEFGYEIVFVDDSVVPLPDSATEQEMMRQVSARRILYTHQTIDITQDVIARMNQRFAAAASP